jgi:hypothetical protein
MMEGEPESRAQIYTYESPNLLYALNWSVSLEQPGCISCCFFAPWHRAMPLFCALCLSYFAPYSIPPRSAR